MMFKGDCFQRAHGVVIASSLKVSLAALFVERVN